MLAGLKSDPSSMRLLAGYGSSKGPSGQGQTVY